MHRSADRVIKPVLIPVLLPLERETHEGRELT